MTHVFLVPFHSEHRPVAGCSGQYLIVENAIRAREGWPYDNGDDPSFYVSRMDPGAPLTWGVCRRPVRLALRAEEDRGSGDIVVFFSYTKSSESNTVNYRLCAVATVAEKRAHHAAIQDERLRGRPYINTMVLRDGHGCRYDETDRPVPARHTDWLWRMMHGKGHEKASVEREHLEVIKAGRFSDEYFVLRKERFADSYVFFSQRADETYISEAPPVVATATIATAGEKEEWNLASSRLKELTLGRARQGRASLRTVNPSHRNLHPHVRFELDVEEARSWRNELIEELRALSSLR